MNDVTLYRMRTKHITLMQYTLQSIGHIVTGTNQQDATTYRDSGDGWTVLEVICHLRDFDGYFRHRAEMILTQDRPDLPAYDHEAIAIEQQYNAQDLYQAYADLVTAREGFVGFFKGLQDADWTRTGNHPERSHPFSMLDALVQVGHHDANHIEQMLRILREKR